MKLSKEDIEVISRLLEAKIKENIDDANITTEVMENFKDGYGKLPVICIRKKNSKIGACLYPTFYEQQCNHLNDIVDEMFNNYLENRNEYFEDECGNIDIIQLLREMYNDNTFYDNLENYIVSPSNKANINIIADLVVADSIANGDLLRGFKINLKLNSVNGSTIITKNLMEVLSNEFGETAEHLAEEVDKRYNKFKIVSLIDITTKMLSRYLERTDISDEDKEKIQKQLEEAEIEKNTMGDAVPYYASYDVNCVNDEAINDGMPFAGLFNKDFRKTIKEQFGNYIIIPASTMEIIILPEAIYKNSSIDEQLEAAYNMVSVVNKDLEHKSPDLVLSNNIYFNFGNDEDNIEVYHKN